MSARITFAVLVAIPGLASGDETSAETRGAARPVREGCALSMGEKDDRGIPQLVADCRWSVPLERVAAIVTDPERLGEALSAIPQNRILADGRVIQIQRMGFGIQERQITLRRWQTALEGGGVEIAFRPARKQEPLGEGRVQIEVNEGWWRIRSDGSGGTHLRYALRYDAGGRLQPWIVRRFQKSQLARSLEELMRAAEADAGEAWAESGPPSRESAPSPSSIDLPGVGASGPAERLDP